MAQSSILQEGSGSQRSPEQVLRIPVAALGWSVGLFLAITYTLCVIFDLIFPGLAMNQAWLRFLPGVIWLTWPSFLLGLVESFVYGWYVALMFAPLFNFFAKRRG